MASGVEVLNMLIPTGGWVITGDDFGSIVYDEGIKPITKKQFQDAFDGYDDWKAKQDAAQATNKSLAQAKLAALGLTVEDLQALGL
jgi:hypothetical protein